MRITIPREQRAEWEVLNDWKFGQHFSKVHLDHTLDAVVSEWVLDECAEEPDLPC